MRRNIKKKKLIVFEGIPGAGKTSIANLLRKEQKTNSWVFLPEIHLDDAHDDLNASFLYIREEIKRGKEIKKFLASDSNVLIMDRNYFSTMAYCFARSRLTGKLSEYRKLETFLKGFLNSGEIYKPTQTIFLDVSIEESIKRRRRFISDPRYKNWFNPIFLVAMQEYYARLSNKLNDSCFVVTTSGRTFSHVYREVNSIMNYTSIS